MDNNSDFQDEVEQRPDGCIVEVSRCTVGEVYWTVAAGTVRDGYGWVQARYARVDPSRGRHSHMFVSMPDDTTNYKGGECVGYAADEEVIDPSRLEYR